MKEILDSIKMHLPESSIRIREILQQLLEEVEFVVESFESNGYLPDELYNIQEELQVVIDDMKLGYGQINLFDGIYSVKQEVPSRPNYEEYIVDNAIPHSLIENFTHIKPYGFMFLNKELVEAKSWKQLYIEACKLFMKIDEKKFLNLENKTAMNGEMRDYFSKEEQNIDLPFKLLDKIYISTRFDANGFRDMLIKMLKEYNYNLSDFTVYFRADYNPLHEF